MNLKLCQVGAFAEQVFEGNPAAVVPLRWLTPVAEVGRRVGLFGRAMTFAAGTIIIGA